MNLILFDADGTLVDSQAIIHDSMVATFDSFGEPIPSLEQSRSIVGLSLELAICTLLDRQKDARTAAMTARYKEAYLDRVHLPEYETKLFPGIRNLIETLGDQDEFLIGMVTGKSRAGIDRLLDGQAMRSFFVTSRCADDCPSKPHPAMVLECCDETGTDPRNTIVIGDTSFDMEMAKSAGAGAIGVSWGYHPVDRLRRSGADTIVNHADEVMHRIGEISKLKPDHV